jgi:hypothetical protein
LSVADTLVGIGWQVVDGTITPPPAPEIDELEDAPGDDI